MSLNCDWNKETQPDSFSEKEQSEWKKIESCTESTIIFIDNLERLGSHSWDLLKSILKLQECHNYLIVLPLNLNKLKNNDPTNKNTEYSIEKYVDFNYYLFKQDYCNFLNTLFDDKNLINKINTILNTSINGANLSIREVEKSFQTYNLCQDNDVYNILRKIKQNIWNPKTFTMVY